MFRLFDALLADGLERGQVLRCKTCTARALDPSEPKGGPFIVQLTDESVFKLDDAIDAARLWRTFLHMQVFGE